MNAEEKVVPIYASSFFSITRDGEFHQFLQYDYQDPELYYATLNQEDLLQEIRKLWLNMQGYLEEEINRVNGIDVYPKVDFCDIQWRTPSNPFFTWVITFRGKLHKGANIYETKTDEEELEYNCYVIWQFPNNTTITKVHTNLYYDIFKSRLVLWGDQGMKIGGWERIHFELPK
ncbi:MAG: hypothetical protein ACTSRS_20240 [Candidatus Helarchaeota archaeon]